MASVSLCALILSHSVPDALETAHCSLLAVMVVGVHEWSKGDTNSDICAKNLMRATAFLREMIDADQPHDLSHHSLNANWKDYLTRLSKFPQVNAGYILSLKDRLIGDFDEYGTVRASLCRSGT